MAWAAALLLVQLFLAWGGGRRDYSARAGSPGRAVIFNLTSTMAPAHKEAARLHPGKFALGMFLHVGVAAAFVEALVAMVKPEVGPLWPVAAGILAGLSVVAGLYLLVRRAVSKTMRLMSCPDDYLAAAVTCGFILTAALYAFGVLGASAFLIFTAVTFFYLPLGKLRHVLFCPVSRVDFGRRLGYRGTYPTPRATKS
jgi:sterol desaturase/sphingolipid hydroxylase (fatty acid hydroxylase superfamily)